MTKAASGILPGNEPYNPHWLERAGYAAIAGICLACLAIGRGRDNRLRCRVLGLAGAGTEPMTAPDYAGRRWFGLRTLFVAVLVTAALAGASVPFIFGRSKPGSISSWPTQRPHRYSTSPATSTLFGQHAML